MKKILIVTSILSIIFSASSLYAADKTLVYHSFDKATGKVIGEVEVQIKDIGDGKKEFVRKAEGEKGEIVDKIILDSEYEAVSWERSYPKDGTQYLAENKGRVLAINGKFENKDIKKNVKIKKNPFYIIPKLSLTKFALVPGINKLKFSIPRRNKLTKMMVMKAEKKGVETITVNGKNVEAIRIYYSATGMREKYYSRDYYFRKSDGIFVKKVEPDGSIEELVSEK